MHRLAFVALIACLAPACVFYTSDDDDCDEYGGGDDRDGDGLAEPANTLRNPDTGECVAFGGIGGGRGGGGACGEAPVETRGETAAAEAPPNWGPCESACNGLGQADCLATDGCRAIYTGECAQDASCLPGDESLPYVGCWATPQPTLPDGACAGLDALTCSEHDDCVAVHLPGGATGGGADAGEGEPDEAPGIALEFGPFSYCAAEPGAIAYCYGAEVVACDAPPPPCLDGYVPTHDGACWTGECARADLCLEGTCGPPTGVCDAALPDCDEGAVPGVGADGCYTGHCIPADECATPPGCGDLDESACIGRGDCAPYYEGGDCTCVGDVCDCETWSFVTCEAT